jgi:hypothetical protein
MNGVLNIGHSKNFVTMNENSKILFANYLHGERNASGNFVSEIHSSDKSSQFVTQSERLPNLRWF